MNEILNFISSTEFRDTIKILYLIVRVYKHIIKKKTKK